MTEIDVVVEYVLNEVKFQQVQYTVQYEVQYTVLYEVQYTVLYNVLYKIIKL